ncbi:MAG: chitobiase/beta-hexosaminidase C-terminal domain-containing protein [Muribaculaceae bacterium]|nr:chitobiase/beta-hexosaminidase C-terminal domain-containing protein [Muribaculaceae bacterium]
MFKQSLLLLAVLMTMVMHAETIEFDFSSEEKIKELYSGDFNYVKNVPLTKSPVTIIASGDGDCSFAYSNGYHLFLKKNVNLMVQAAEGWALESISFDVYDKKLGLKIGDDTYNADNNQWTATTDVNQVAFTTTSSFNRITKITLTYKKTAAEKPASPVIGLAAGNYIGKQTVEITHPNGGTIYYQIDDDAVQTYTAPFAINAESRAAFSLTLAAWATESGHEEPSDKVSATYVFVRPEQPVFSRSSGEVAAGTQVTITAPADATLKYVVNGETTVSATNEVLISIIENTTLTACSVENEVESEEVTAQYTLKDPNKATIEFNYGTDNVEIMDGSDLLSYITPETRENVASATVNRLNDKKIYQSFDWGVRLGNDKNIGEFSLRLSDAIKDRKIARIVVQACLYGSGEGGFLVGPFEQSPLTASLARYTYEVPTPQTYPNLLVVSLSNKPCYIKSITLEFVDENAPKPLAQIEREGKTDEVYTIADDLQVVAVCPERQVAWVRDLAESIHAIEVPSFDTSTIDYMVNAHQQTGEWQQNNWLMLDMTDVGVQNIMGKENMLIKGGTLSGTLVDLTNYTLRVAAKPEYAPAEANYARNVYCAGNFYDSDVMQESASGARSYFFMRPKPMEVAQITWVVWENEAFYMPKAGQRLEGGGIANAAGLHGAFEVDMTYNEPSDFVPADGEMYQFAGVVMRKTDAVLQARHSPVLTDPDSELSTHFVVCPLNLSAADEHVVTAVAPITADKTLVGTTYVNAMGQVNPRPHKGFNVVITRYDDGSSRQQKQMLCD